jgi:hypothetical protein
MFFIRMRSRDALKISLHIRASGTPRKVTSGRASSASSGQVES